MAGSHLAWLDSSRQLQLGDELARPNTVPPTVAWGSWGTPVSEEIHSWPTWSPDGRRVASFRVTRAGEEGCQVRITEADGISAAELATLGDRLPIYLQWAPSGREVAILTQSGDHLRLDAARLDDLGTTRSRLTGSPLFYEQAPGYLVAFVGGDDGPQLLVLDEHDHRTLLHGPPGNFCAPVVLDGHVLYVVTRGVGAAARLVRSPLSGGEAQELAEVRGLAALVGSPCGRRLAFSQDPDGTGKAYRGISILDPATGAEQQLTDLPVIAFLWTPQSDALIAAERREGGTVRWHAIGLDGYHRVLVDLLPTRDLRFYLRFFEQFASSHRLVDPAGEHLVLAGGVVGRDDPGGTPRLWRVSLQDDHIEELTDGTFAVYAHPSSAGSEP